MQKLKFTESTEMEILVFLVFFSMMLTPCVTQPQGNEVQFSSPSLPRKLRVLVVDERTSYSVSVKVDGSRSFAPDKTDISGKAYARTKNEVDKSKGNREEWMEAQYFTMDYRPVKRRRPIHNKYLPVSP